MRAERRTGANLGYWNSETVPYMARKKLERREYKVRCEGVVTGWRVLILEIGVKIY